MVRDEVEQKIIALVEPVLQGYSLELVDLEYQAGRKGHLCLYIDKPGGATIGDCETVSREVSDLLDMYDPIPHRYVLEVSTPGIERPLRKQADFQRFTGEAVKVYSDGPVNGRNIFIGVLSAADDEKIRLTLEEAEEIELSYDQIARAHLWYRPTKGAKTKSKRG